jgi:hypothetical protein
MQTFSQFITESIQVGMAKKAWNSLSYEAKSAIEDWESMNWNNGPLVRHIKANDAVAQEIERAFQPIRDSFKTKTIKLYRGVQLDGEFDQDSKYLYSWTLKRKEAEYFAGRASRSGRIRYNEPLTDTEIAALYKQFASTGYIKYRQNKYVRSRSNPKYYNIYSGREMVTDGNFPEDFMETLKNDQEWDTSRKEKYTKGIVLERDIPVDKIVWISNNLGSLEFIVKK